GGRRKRRGGAARGRAQVPGESTPQPPPRRDRSGDAHDPDPMGLIPGPDETTFLPRIPSRNAPAPPSIASPANRKRGIKRHRDGSPSAARLAAKVSGELFLTFGVIVM